MRETMLVFHFIGLTMGLGTGFAHAFLGIIAAKMSADEATKFRMHSLVLSRMGNIGIVLLLISGLYLITPYWKTLPSSPLLILKLAFITFLLVLITLINLSVKKAKNGDELAQLKKMATLGKMTLIAGLIIVILAVGFFR